jgi:hypothetical protein
LTNPFELFLDYGQMIYARSRAKRTFLVQFACDAGGYLPTARAVAAGGYSALIINGLVGPEGGRMLVDATVNAIDRLWGETPRNPPARPNAPRKKVNSKAPGRFTKAAAKKRQRLVLAAM